MGETFGLRFPAGSQIWMDDLFKSDVLLCLGTLASSRPGRELLPEQVQGLLCACISVCMCFCVWFFLGCRCWKMGRMCGCKRDVSV